MTTELPFCAMANGIQLFVRLTPKAARNSLHGIVQGVDGRPALRLRIAAPPIEGAANAALIAYLAKVLKLRQSDIKIAAGETSRLKRLELLGNSDLIASRLDRWIAAADENESPGP